MMLKRIVGKDRNELGHLPRCANLLRKGRKPKKRYRHLGFGEEKEGGEGIKGERTARLTSYKGNVKDMGKLKKGRDERRVLVKGKEGLRALVGREASSRDSKGQRGSCRKNAMRGKGKFDPQKAEKRTRISTSKTHDALTGGRSTPQGEKHNS